MAYKKQQLIWLGAGTAKQPAINFSDYQQVTLLDAREDATRALIKQYGDSGIEVITKLVSDTTERSSLQIYNLPEFSAISPATGLKALFPGLKLVNSESLNSQSVSDLLQVLNFSGVNNTLILDIPDQALNILHNLKRNNSLELFETIYLQYGTTQLYADMPPLQQLVEFLQQEYLYLYETDDSDPDLPIFNFRHNALAKENAKLKQDIKVLTESVQAAEEQSNRNLIASENKVTELEQQLEELKLQLTQEKQQAAQQNTALHMQLDALKQHAQAEKQQAERVKNELVSQLEELNHQLSSRTKNLETKIFEFAKEKEVFQTQIKKLEAELECASKDSSKIVESHKAEHEILTSMISKLQDDLRIEKEKAENQTLLLSNLESDLRVAIEEKAEILNGIAEVKAEYENRINKETTEKEVYLKDIEKLKLILDDKELAIKRKISEIETLSELNKERIAELNKRVEEVESENTGLKAIVDNAKKLSDVKQIQFNDLYAKHQMLVKQKYESELAHERAEEALQESISLLEAKVNEFKLLLDNHFSSNDIVAILQQEKPTIKLKQNKQVNQMQTFLLEKIDELLLSQIEVRRTLIDEYIAKN